MPRQQNGGAFFVIHSVSKIIFPILTCVSMPRITLAIGLLFFAGCSVTSTPMRTTPPDDASEVFVDPSVNMRSGIDPVNIKSAQQIGEFLVLDVSYSGGCEDHDFRLESKGRYTSTYPPEVEVALKHNSNNDRCRGIIDKKLWFNLTPLQYEGTNRVLLVVTNTNMTLEYNY